MGRRFLSGIAFGALFGFAGLTVLSQVFGPVDPPAEVMEPAAPVTAPPEAAVQTPTAPLVTDSSAVPQAPAATAPAPSIPSQAPAPVIQSQAPASGTAPAIDRAVTPLVPRADSLPATPDAPTIIAGVEAPVAPDTSQKAVAEPEVQAEVHEPAALPDLPGQVGVTTPAAAPVSAANPQIPAAPQEPTAQAAPEAPQAPPAAPVLPAIVEEPSEALAPESGQQPDPDPVAGSTLAPAPRLGSEVNGVTVGRLPRIGITAPAAEPVAPPPPTEAQEAEDTRPPVERFARAFDNPSQKPLMSIVLRDTGGPDIDRQSLADLPFPVSFVIDPAAPDAAVAAAIYRAGGQEVVMLASGITDGLTPSDLEVSFAVYGQTLPEAVAVADAEIDGFQGNRLLAGQVLTVVAGQGRGVLTWDRGLNAASQIARREGMQNAIIFRSLDAEGEEAPLIRRYLDRAAFKAAQDGRVIVAGQTRAETVAALIEWVDESRAESVVLAPVTAVMTSR